MSHRKSAPVLEPTLTRGWERPLDRRFKKAPPPPPFRQIFLRVKAPIGPLKTTAISTAFRVWARRSGVAIPGRGSSHRVRHSYAVLLLLKGTSLKTIGELLCHRTAEPTCPYLRPP